jgi:hypothetical protein
MITLGIIFHVSDVYQDIFGGPSSVEAWRIISKAFGVTKFICIDETQDRLVALPTDQGITFMLADSLSEAMGFPQASDRIIGVETKQLINASGKGPQVMQEASLYSDTATSWIMFGPAMGFSVDNIQAYGDSWVSIESISIGSGLSAVHALPIVLSQYADSIPVPE